MPVERLALILFIAFAGAGLTVWLGTLLFAPGIPAFARIGVLVPVALFGWLFWRVLAARLADKEDDHYDRIEK